MAMEPETAVSTVTDPMVVVELRDGDEEREYLRAPIKESMWVQDALKGSGAIHRFKRMDIKLVRRLAGRDTLNMPIHYDSTNQCVVRENNYAMQGGDWLVVTEDTSTTFDRMIEHALQPLRPVMRNYQN